MSPESMQIADEYWTGDFGCALTDLRPSEPRVQRHAGGLIGYAGVMVLVTDTAPLISVPDALFDAVAPRAHELTVPAIRDVQALTALLAPAKVTRVIGPALLHYADRACFTPVEAPGARRLNPADEAALTDLAAACAPVDWEPKEFSIDSEATFGAFAPDGTLMACADNRIWADRVAHVSVATRPSARSQGYGTRAVACAVEAALAAGLVAQYRVLEQNAASRRIAEKLGFVRYGFTVAARLAAT